jgi:hypothetical protein
VVKSVSPIGALALYCLDRIREHKGFGFLLINIKSEVL